MQKRILLVGAYGIRNAGDDAPLEFLVRGLRSRHPSVDFRFDVLARHRDPMLEQRLGVRFRRNLEHASRAAAAGRRFRGFNSGDGGHAPALAEALVRRADLVVAGAGNVLVDIAIDLLRGPIPLLAMHAWLADLHAVPLLLFGIGAGPLTTRQGRDLSAWILRRATCVTVREEASASLLRGLAPGARIEVLPDPVLGLARAGDGELDELWEREGLAARGRRPRLAVSVRDPGVRPRAGSAADHRPRLVAALRELAAEFDLLFVPQCTGIDCDDREEALEIARQLPAGCCSLLVGRYAAPVLQRVYESAEASLAMRLHAAVLSTMGGTPTTALAYLPKVRHYMEGMGLGAQVLELDVEPGAIVRAVRDSRSRDRSGLDQRLAAGRLGTARYLEHVERLLGLGPGTPGLPGSPVACGARR